MEKRMLREREACEYVGLSHNACRKYYAKAIVKCGKAVRYDIYLLDQLIEERRKDEGVNLLGI